MIKTALLFFEHQLPLAQSLLRFLESKHPVFILNESLRLDIQKLKSEFPEFSITAIDPNQLRKALCRLRQALFAHVPSRHKAFVKELKSSFSKPILTGISPLVKVAKARIEKSLKQSSKSLLNSSAESLRRSLKVLVDDYEELVDGGLAQSSPKADLTRAPKIRGVRGLSKNPLEIQAAQWPFRPKGGLILKADVASHPEAARLLTETIRRRS